MDELIKKTLKALLNLKNAVIVGHSGPDGDSIGASVALASLLTRVGLRAIICQRDSIPQELIFLAHGRVKVCEKLNLEGKDVLIFMECFLPERSGFSFTSGDLEKRTVINIDHHPDNKKYADFNIVDPNVSSVSEIIYNFFRIQKLPILKNEAVPLLAGIMTDTGRFSQENATSDALLISADLMKKGADLNKLYNKIYGSQRQERIKLLALTLKTLEILSGGRVALLYTDRKMFDETGGDYSDTKDFINYARDIKGVEAACYLRETADGKAHLNLRSLRKNTLPFIKKFGGGGHRLASGATIDGNFSEIIEKVKKEFCDFFSKK